MAGFGIGWGGGERTAIDCNTFDYTLQATDDLITGLLTVLMGLITCPIWFTPTVGYHDPEYDFRSTRKKANGLAVFRIRGGSLLPRQGME